MKDLQNAESIVEMDLRLRLAVLSMSFRPFMLNAPNHTGPAVVGLSYDIMIRPFRCGRSSEVKFDLPWAGPCLEIGFVHRSEHNADDGTYGSTYVNSLAARMRLLSADESRTAVWLRCIHGSPARSKPAGLSKR